MNFKSFRVNYGNGQVSPIMTLRECKKHIDSLIGLSTECCWIEKLDQDWNWVRVR